MISRSCRRLTVICGLLAGFPFCALSQGHNVEVVGAIGGRVKAVAVLGDVVYISEGRNLTILDVANPSAPELINRIFWDGIIAEIVVSGSRAYVVDEQPGLLKVLDVTDPSVPVLMGTYGPVGWATGLAVDGNRVYLAANERGLHVIDFSDASAPALLTVYPGYISDVALSGDLVFVTDRLSGFEILDLSDPALHSQIAKVPITRLGGGGGVSGGNLFGVAVSDSLAFVMHSTLTADDLDGMDIFDISDPAEPIRLKVVGGEGKGIAVDGSLLYYPGGDSPFGSLLIFDISDPSNISQAGVYDSPGRTQNIVLAGGLAFVTNADFGLEVLDLTDPKDPVLQGRYQTSGSLAQSIAVSDSRVYLVDQEIGMGIVDVSDPQLPRLLGTFSEHQDFQDFQYYVDVAIDGAYAYLAADPETFILDISDPEVPILLGTLPSRGWAVTISDGLMYLADLDVGLRIVDVSTPASPRVIGEVPRSFLNRIRDVDVVGSRAFLAGNLLEIFDVTDPTDPVKLGDYSVEGDAEAVEVVGSLAYVISDIYGTGKLEIIDVSNPAQPRVQGSVVAILPFDVAVAGSKAYMAAQGLRVVDVSDPADPRLRGAYMSGAVGVAVEGSLIYLLDWDGSLVIFRFTGATPPPADDAWIERIIMPPPVQMGEEAEIEIRVRNVGLSVWSSEEKYGLAVVDDPGAIWEPRPPQFTLPPGTNVAPNELYTFTATLRTPRDFGLYNLQVQMARDSAVPFGQKGSLTIQVNPRIFTNATQAWWLLD